MCFDQAVLRPGDNWHDDLPRHLRSSTVVVALVSQHTGAAHYENEELIMAIDQVRREGGRLVPLRLQAGAPLPYGTHALHALDYLDDDDTPAVVAAIADVARNPTTLPLVAGTQVWCPGCRLCRWSSPGATPWWSGSGHRRRGGRRRC